MTQPHYCIIHVKKVMMMVMKQWPCCSRAFFLTLKWRGHVLYSVSTRYETRVCKPRVQRSTYAISKHVYATTVFRGVSLIDNRLLLGTIQSREQERLVEISVSRRRHSFILSSHLAPGEVEGEVPAVEHSGHLSVATRSGKCSQLVGGYAHLFKVVSVLYLLVVLVDKKTRRYVDPGIDDLVQICPEVGRENSHGHYFQHGTSIECHFVILRRGKRANGAASCVSPILHATRRAYHEFSRLVLD